MVIDIHVDFSGFDVRYFDKYFKIELTKRLNTFGKRITGKGDEGLKRHLERAGGYAPNSMVWSKGGKDGKRVFYNTGNWRNSPTFQVIPPMNDMYAGVKVYFPSMSHPAGRGITMDRLANQLVKGFQYNPSPKQRMMFWSKIDKSALGSGFQPTPKAVYTSPSRDFTKYLQSPRIRNLMGKYVKEAVDAAVKSASKRKR